MAIGKVGDYISSALQKAQDTSPRTTSEEKASTGKETTAATDKVEISKGAQEISKVSKVATDKDDIRTELVDRVRSSLAAGTYSVSPEKISSKMLDEIM